MPLMQPPVVIWDHERMLLLRQPNLDRILLDIRNRPPDLLRMIEKHAPSRSAPDWMIHIEQFARPQQSMRFTLKIPNDLLRLMLVLANEQVHVIRHNRARVAGV